MSRAWKVCAAGRCPELVPPGTTYCDADKRAKDKARGTPRERGYAGPGWQRSRRAALRRDPLCVCTDTAHGHGEPCGQPSTVADHYPDERRDLVAAGVTDPDAPHRLVGRCRRCHDLKTAHTTGWSSAPVGGDRQ